RRIGAGAPFHRGASQESQRGHRSGNEHWPARSAFLPCRDDPSAAADFAGTFSNAWRVARVTRSVLAILHSKMSHSHLEKVDGKVSSQPQARIDSLFSADRRRGREGQATSSRSWDSV